MQHKVCCLTCILTHLCLLVLFLLQVSSPELVRDVLVTRQDEFSGHPSVFVMSAYVHFQEELFSNDSPSWRQKKKAVHTSLKM